MGPSGVHRQRHADQHGRDLGCPGVILALANAEPEGCVAAWSDGSGDGAAQRALTTAHLAQRDHGGFPHGIKHLTAARFGTPTHTRMG